MGELLLKVKKNNPIEKLDLVMWTKNSAKTLPYVLNRIDKVIPKKVINNKIIVDDHSTDKTVEIAKSFGWYVYNNPGTGIASGANEALKHVTTRFFASFEHDVLLSKDWWEKISRHMEDESVAVAQGVRLPTNLVLRKIEEYALRREEAYRLISLDNNIFCTEKIRQVGGFPSECPVCIDQNLRDNIEKAGFKWIIDKSVVSDHLRQSVKEELNHHYQHSLRVRRELGESFFNLLRRFAFSPIRALHVVYEEKCPQIFIVYPYIRFIKLKAFLDRRKIVMIPYHFE
jgi:glycosyltransferase involved in cell wall biosynthesis